MSIRRPRRCIRCERRSTPRFTCSVSMQVTAHGVDSESGPNVYIRTRSWLRLNHNGCYGTDGMGGTTPVQLKMSSPRGGVKSMTKTAN